MKRRKLLSWFGLAIASGSLVIACSTENPNAGSTPRSESTTPAGNQTTQELTIYSGRDEKLIGELIEKFKTQTGTNVKVRYGGTAELAAAILEEGNNTPADVFFAQDAGALGALQKAKVTAKLPDNLLEPIEERFRSPAGEWVGITGRVRTVDYNTDLVTEDQLPESIFDLTDPQWEGKIGWAPTNASFQAFVTALRVSEGEERAKEWLEKMKANNPKEYPKNTAIIEALSRGEIALGLVNHYYLERVKSEEPGVPVAHHYTNDVGALVNVAGVAILKNSDNPELAQKFVAFLESEEAQKYFADKTYEYPLAKGISSTKNLKSLEEIKYPAVDLSNLDDLEATLKLLQDTGVL